MTTKVKTLIWLNIEHDDGQRTTKEAEDLLDEWLAEKAGLINVVNINRSDSGSSIASNKTVYTIVYELIPPMG